MLRVQMMKVIGLNLAGTQDNPTGFSLLSGREFRTGLINLDEEILDLCLKSSPRVVAIDAPLTLPSRGNLRLADALLIGRGFRVFPPTFAGMRALTARGMGIAEKLRAGGLRVIEIHPRTSGKVLFGTSERKVWISRLSRAKWEVSQKISEHEIDAVIAALTGWLYLKKRTEEVGEPGEGVIVMPRGPL